MVKSANNGEFIRLVDQWGNTATNNHTGGDWPRLAAGGGSSLELRHPDMDNSDPSHGQIPQSNKQVGRVLILVTVSAVNDSRLSSDYEELHMFAVGDAHIALRNVSLTRNTSSKYFPVAEQFLVLVPVQMIGSAKELIILVINSVTISYYFIRSEPKANRCEIDVTQISRNDNLKFTCQARWISGKPTLVVNTWDRSFGGVLHLELPSNLGSAGASNTSLISSPAPTVSGLLHSPAVPTSSDPD